MLRFGRGPCWGTRTEQPRYRLIGINLGVELEYTNIKGAVLDHTVELTITPFNLWVLVPTLLRQSCRRELTCSHVWAAGTTGGRR